MSNKMQDEQIDPRENETFTYFFGINFKLHDIVFTRIK